MHAARALPGGGDVTAVGRCGHEPGDVPAGSCRWGTGRRRRRADAAGQGGAPARCVAEVVAHHVPPPGPHHQVVRFDAPRGDEVRVVGAGAGQIRPQHVDLQGAPVTDGAPDGGEVTGGMGGAAKFEEFGNRMSRSDSIAVRTFAGSTWIRVSSARAASSPRPKTVVGAVCRATATASAWSSSNSRGGSVCRLAVATVWSAGIVEMGSRAVAGCRCRGAPSADWRQLVGQLTQRPPPPGGSSDSKVRARCEVSATPPSSPERWPSGDHYRCDRRSMTTPHHPVPASDPPAGPAAPGS